MLLCHTPSLVVTLNFASLSCSGFRYKIKPRLGGPPGGPTSLASAALRLPTLAGYIEVDVKTKPTYTVTATLPCNTVASLCVPKSAAAAGASTLSLDGEKVPAVADGRHLCVSAGCGAGGAARVLTV